MTTLIWFRQDLRLADNPALAAGLRQAARTGGDLIPVYVDCRAQEGAWAPGAASRWWLHHSLNALRAQLRALGSDLVVRSAEDCGAELERLACETGARHIFWNRRYEPAIVARDARLKARWRELGLDPQSFNGSLLHEPWDVQTQSGGAYQVFTPFWRRCLSLPDPPQPEAAPDRLPPPSRWPASEKIDHLRLLPRIRWSAGLENTWVPGTSGALALLDDFLGDRVWNYADARNRPDVRGTSGLSPHLHHGEISPRQIWHRVRTHAQAQNRPDWRQSAFLAEIGWREFAHHLLFHFPQTPESPLRENFARFPWRSDAAGLRAWERGLTGYPIVDAGMRQLWRTGWMHNRVRMIVASFLVKDLMIDWQSGARWFWDTLVDADLASNTLGWQWSAGCGADAAPYFRIFNPASQGRRFDPDGAYVRAWVPEIAGLPDRWIHEPDRAPAPILAQAQIRIGTDYPAPLVEHSEARKRALAAFASLKKSDPRHD